MAESYPARTNQVKVDGWATARRECGNEQAESKIVSRQLLRVPYSYPVPTIGRDRALAAIHPWLTKQGIYSRGRFGAWRYEIGNTDHSVMQGVEIVDYILQGTPERTWALLPGEEARVRIT
jgi:hypothetical protein